MSATDTRLRGRTRWSAASKCSRWAALGLLGAEPAEPSQRTQRLWRRGRQLGADRAEQFAARFGVENVIREKAVPWPATGLPLGELHVDVYVAPEKLAVEIKSSTSPSSLLEDALTQLAGELHFDPEAEAGALMIVDPSGWNEDELLPFVLTPAWVEKVEAIAAEVGSAAKGGALPDCACGTPGACRAKGCPFTEVAWEGWEPPNPVALDGETAVLVTELYQAKQARDARKAQFEEGDGAYREICARLAELGIAAGYDYMVGPLKMRRTTVAGRETFSLSRARKTGVWEPSHDDLFGPFLKLGDPHDRWSIDRVGDGPLVTPEDFGDDVPF